MIGATEVYLPLAGLIDMEAERERLTKELRTAVEQVERLEKLLAGPFAEKAPPEVVQNERAKLAEWQATRAKLEERSAALTG